MRKTKTRQKRKFEVLVQRNDPRPQTKARWIVNLSSKTLSDDQKRVLSHGMNFAPAPRKIPVPEIVSTVESALRRTNQPIAAAEARLRIFNLLARHNTPPSNLTPGESKALKELKQEKSLIIIPADKGRATVVMDREDYDGKLHSMLQDTTTYRRIEKDPSLGLERRMNSMLLDLRKKGELSDMV